MPSIPMAVYRAKLDEGFTLIELLIVVAIIAILAAIAVPNFLEAQVRSKISRSKGDMHSIMTAIEVYRIDWNTYPWYPFTGSGLRPRKADIDSGFCGFTPPSMTTPMAYMTSLPRDPFVYSRNTYSNLPLLIPNPLYLYNFAHREQHNKNSGPNYADWDQQGPGERVGWAIVGMGPDLFSYLNESGILVHGNLPEFFIDMESKFGTLGWYDPTNGTVSYGEIITWGPGGSWEFPGLVKFR